MLSETGHFPFVFPQKKLHLKKPEHTHSTPFMILTGFTDAMLNFGSLNLLLVSNTLDYLKIKF